MPNRLELRNLLGSDPEGFVRQTLVDLLAVLHVTSADELLTEPGAVHDLRVAIRTLRSLLVDFLPYFRGASKIKRHTRELKWIDEKLQVKRDLEVQIELLDGVADEKLQNLISKPARYQHYRKQVLSLVAELQASEKEALASLVEAFASERKSKFFEEFKSALLFVEFKPNKISKLERELGRLLADQKARIHKSFSKPNFSNASYKRLHLVRLAAKRARYLAEAIGESSANLAEAQRVLGEINDLANLRQWLSAKIATKRRDRKVVLSLVLQVETDLKQLRRTLRTMQL